MRSETAFQQKLRSLTLEHLGFVPREVQLAATSLLGRRTIVEMETGEGKTLSVAVAAITMARRGQRVFVATANDYLASRDAADMAPIFNGFGLRAGALSSQADHETRRLVYACDVAYGTIREFGFDTLRDALTARAASRPDRPMVPKFDALIVDEADSVLIDEAMTPLVISETSQALTPSDVALYRWSAEHAKTLTPEMDFVSHPPTGRIALTERGMIKTIECRMRPEMSQCRMPEIVHSLERSLEVATRLFRDVHYLVKDDRVLLIDEYTGRLATAKKLSSGLHQAIEAKEGLPMTPAGHTVARMTIQELVNRVPYLSGMTATAREDRAELGKVYGLNVKRLPPHHPSKRIQLPPQLFMNRGEKELGIIADVRNTLAVGRSVLIGTRTIEHSESLSSLFDSHQLAHMVLNARQSSEEASIISQAGQRGRVTVATNMAGRGTDIRITDQVRAAGGLHVIVSEPHAAARIDRQLAGRCGRQGDPGTVRHFFSPDEEILELGRGQTSDSPVGTRTRLDSRLARAKLLWQTKRAQARIGRRHREMRMQLAQAESQMASDLRELGLDPHLDRITEAGE